ncbi:MAG: hypothetical protein AB7H92_18190, partial [Microbacteriaceae bacterium]
MNIAPVIAQQAARQPGTPSEVRTDAHLSAESWSAYSRLVVIAIITDWCGALCVLRYARSGLDDILTKLLSFDGAMSAALVDSETGMILGKAGTGIDMDLAAAGASVILRARLASIKALGSDERIDDVLISLSSQVQIIHPLPSNPSIFTYLIGDKSKSSLAMARYKAAEADLQIQL